MDTDKPSGEKWELQMDEELLREQLAEFQGKIDHPLTRLSWATLSIGFALILLWVNGSFIIDYGLRWYSILGVAGAFVSIRFGLPQFQTPEPSDFADMERYVFTNQRISLLDTSGHIIDEIEKQEIEEIVFDDLFGVTCIRPNDPKQSFMFVINHFEQLEEIFDFVKAHYGPQAK